MKPMDDLTTRLLAAIEETERIAGASMGGPDRPDAGVWTRECGHVDFDNELLPTGHDQCCVVDGDIRIYDEGGHGPEDAEHIAHNDPKTVLRRCAADRKIVELHSVGWSIAHSCIAEPDGWGERVVFERYCPTLLLLAEGYGITEETTDNA